MRLTLLGTGTSMGIPQIGCGCGVCRSTDPRDRRSRCAALLSTDTTTLLIDTPPELRLQLLACGVGHVDAVLYTHHHADHIHGIDDLRSFSLDRPAPVPIYGSVETMDHLRTAFSYIFDGTPAVEGTSKPGLSPHHLEAGEWTTISGLPILPLRFAHGTMPVLGYRSGSMAYLTDIKTIDHEAVAHLRGVDTLVLNALRWEPHPTHLTIDEAIAAARAIGARRTVLTHLTHATSHTDLLRDLPDGVEPGYDGLTLEIP